MSGDRLNLRSEGDSDYMKIVLDKPHRSWLIILHLQLETMITN